MTKYTPTKQELALGAELAAIFETSAQLDAAGLAEITLPKEARETKENIIVPEGLMGRERWFIKKNLHGFSTNEAGQIVITATKRQLKDRGIDV